MIAVHTITPAIIDALLTDLRPIDRLEMSCMLPTDQREGLLSMVARARRCRAVTVNGRLTCIFGVSAAGVLSNEGCPWMLGTSALATPAGRRAVIAESRVGLTWLAQDFDRLWNVVAAENVEAIRWLRWLGFEFGDSTIIRRHEFRYFFKKVDRSRGGDQRLKLVRTED